MTPRGSAQASTWRPAPPDEAALRPVVVAASTRLLDTYERRTDEVAHAIVPAVLATMRPYQAYSSPRMEGQLLEQAREHVRLITHMARTGRLLTARDLEFARQVGMRRVAAAPLGAILRGYRTGHRAMIEWIASQAGSDPDDLRTALHLTACCFEYLDSATAAVAVGYLQQHRPEASPLAELEAATRQATAEAVVALARAAAPPSAPLSLPPLPKAAGAGSLSASQLFLAGLSPRERDLVVLVAQGLTNKEIAHHLRISLYTTKEYMSRVLEKTRLPSRAAVAAAFAAQQPGSRPPA